MNDTELVPVARVIAGITFFVTLHMHDISIVRSINFKPCTAYYYYRISHFSALAGKYSPILGCSNQQD